MHFCCCSKFCIRQKLSCNRFHSWCPFSIASSDLSARPPHTSTQCSRCPSKVRCHFGWSVECPHRLVPLSEGRIESNGMLQCAYHGWEFDQDGGCTRIPQLDGQNPNTSGLVQCPRACATSFPARVEQGLLWIFPTADEALAKSKEPALIAKLDDPENGDGTNFFVRDMPYSWDILVENLSEPAHVPFAHHSFMRGADRNQGLDATRHQGDGRNATRLSSRKRPRNRAIQSQLSSTMFAVL
jgi:phenylpropionate dioxygenase-like ring-hydroxylating dioxygenase large terminal subunit